MPIAARYPANAEMQREWELSELIIDAIRLYAIAEEVRMAKTKFEAGRKATSGLEHGIVDAAKGEQDLREELAEYRSYKSS